MPPPVADLTGQVMTVSGPVPPDRLGITNPHEHLIIDLLAVDTEVQESHSIAVQQGSGSSASWDDPISLRTYYEARRNPFLFRDNLQLTDLNDAAEALVEFKQAGGGCIVDLTPIGVGRDPEGLRYLAEKTGVKVVMGTGFYVNEYHPETVASLSEDAICELIVNDIVEGSGPSAVRPGIIGEIGLVWPTHERERRVLRAAARAQQATGYCLTIHPGRNPAGPLEAIRIVESAGGDPARTVIGHLDRTLFEIEDFLELAQTGCFLELDLFGAESSFYPLAEIDMPNDAMRVNTIVALAENGHLDQALVSLDICFRTKLTKYGGEGYHHILTNVVPIMERKGFSPAEVDRLLRVNPQRVLTIA